MNKANKYLLSVDIEGITGVVNREFTSSSGKYYALAQKYMANDVNGVINGILKADPDAFIVVRDAHGRATNLDLEKLHPRASLVQGWGNSMNIVEALDSTYRGVFLVGYHASGSNDEAVLAHTMSDKVQFLRINDTFINETGIAALYAGYYQVPVAFLSGDDHAVREAHQQLGDKIIGVAVKESLSRDAAVSVSLSHAHGLLEAGAYRATELLLQRDVLEPFTMSLPLQVEIQLYNTGFFVSTFAKMKSMLSFTKVFNFDSATHTIKYASSDMLIMMQFLDLLLSLMYAIK